MLIRLAISSDAEDLLRWRNDPISRSMFINGEEVGNSEHNAWFQKALHDPLVRIYIGEIGGAKIGVCRIGYQLGQDRYEVSINLDPSFRGKGMSFPLLTGSLAEFRRHLPVPIVALVRVENLRSQRLFSSAGFVQISEGDGLRTFVLPTADESIEDAHL